MGTLRKEFHEIGNRLNSAFVGVTMIKDFFMQNKEQLGGMEDYDSADLSVGVAERNILQALNELDHIKNVVYRHVNPEKGMSELKAEIRGANESIKLLIVDDDMDVAMLLQKRFLKRGFIVFHAPNVAEAKRLLETENPDVALCDFYLENNETGVEVLRFIKERGMSTQCLVVTREADDDVLDQVRVFEPFEILVKPVHFQQLDVKINAAAASRGK